MPTRSSTRPSTRPPTRPPSPSRDAGAIDDLSSALHEALQPLQETEHGKHEKFPPTLEIAVNQELLALKGTGPDVEPALLAGSVKLHLSEPMSIREITLSFRGKARVPPPTGEPLSLSASGLTYIVCDHEWSFLEGTKGHSHTLKAGHHVFPFQMQIGGSLPSSIYTSALGSASVSYKLRAVAVRPGLAHNLQAQAPVSVVRSFTPEALEYQQTLEIENTWPEKLMYSIMVPHKAYAIGDRLTALMKFEPIAKGVKVMSIVTTLNETVKITSRAGQAQEITRIVMTTKHEIAGGKAVCVEEFANRRPLHGPVTPHAHAHRTGSTPGTPSTSPTASTSYFPPVASSSSAPEPLPSDISLPEDLEPSETEVVTTMALPLPAHAGITPTHALEPLVVTHRVRWSILIANPDGHTSELRCSLPLHILDGRLLREARAATRVTRNLLLGGADGGEGIFAEERDAEVDLELPSYSAHVRDRVANASVPDAVTVRVAASQVPSGVRTPSAGGSSGVHSPAEDGGLHLPSHPAAGTDAHAPLDWVNSELMMLSEEPVTHGRARAGSGRGASLMGAVMGAAEHSPPDSGGPSYRGSRRESRAPSPERERERDHAHETFVHSSTASRGTHGVFHASMKPFTSLASGLGLTSSRSLSHGSLGSFFHVAYPPQLDPRHPHHTRPTAATATVPSTPAEDGMRAYNAVPDYAVASRGFLGGVPPLSSMSGLPSYDEAEAAAHPRSVGSDEAPRGVRFQLEPGPGVRETSGAEAVR